MNKQNINEMLRNEINGGNSGSEAKRTEGIPAYLVYPDDSISQCMFANQMAEVSSKKCKYKFVINTQVADTTPRVCTETGSPQFLNEIHIYSKYGSSVWYSVNNMQGESVRSSSMCNWIASDQMLMMFGATDKLLHLPKMLEGESFKQVLFCDLGESDEYNRTHSFDESHIFARVYNLGEKLYKQFILLARKDDKSWRVEINFPSDNPQILPPDYVPAGQTFGKFFPLADKRFWRLKKLIKK